MQGAELPPDGFHCPSVWFPQELERRASYNASGMCSDLSFMVSETSPDRWPSLPSSAAELPADVHPNVFLGDVLSWISLQCTRQGVGSRAMSAAIKHFLKKKNSSPKCEAILLVTHWGFCRLRLLIALLCLLFTLQLKYRVALMLLCISQYWFFFSCLHLIFSPLFPFFPFRF